MTVVWMTNKNCVSKVQWGLKSTDENTAVSSHHGLVNADTMLHSIRLEGLRPGTSYVYCVVSKEILVFQPYKVVFGDTVTDGPYSFTTLDENKEKISFFAISDVHEKVQRLDEMLTSAGTEGVDFVIYNGDMINYFTRESQLFDGFLDISVKHFARRKPFVYVMGNHEVRGKLARTLSHYFPPPDGKFYYSFRHGPVCFIVMDSGEDKPDDNSEYYGLVDFDRYRQEQLQWFQQKVSQTPEFQNAAFRVVLSHIPPYAPRNEKLPKFRFYGEMEIADKWLPAFNEKGVDIMLCGHLHQYIKMEPGKINNRFPIVVGSHWTVTQVDATEQKLKVTVQQEGIDIIDQFVVPKNKTLN